MLPTPRIAKNSLIACGLALACLTPVSAIGGQCPEQPAAIHGNRAIAGAEPPYSGTIFIDADIITAGDPTVFVDLIDAGVGVRNMFDRRCNCFADYDVYLFDASYADLPTVEIDVNQEFGSAAARSIAEFYAPVVGQLPQALRKDVHALWIHQGDEPFGGGNDSLLIHTGSIAQSYIDQGILEEALAHEAGHTSLEVENRCAPEWVAAQGDDPNFISTYARDNPFHEDVPESFLVWLAARHTRGRISAVDAETIETTIPNRLDYFDTLGLNLDPFPVFADEFEPRFD